MKRFCCGLWLCSKEFWFGSLKAYLKLKRAFRISYKDFTRKDWSL